MDDEIFNEVEEHRREVGQELEMVRARYEAGVRLLPASYQYTFMDAICMVKVAGSVADGDVERVNRVARIHDLLLAAVVVSSLFELEDWKRIENPADLFNPSIYTSGVIAAVRDGEGVYLTPIRALGARILTPAGKFISPNDVVAIRTLMVPPWIHEEAAKKGKS
jgi:hypothetical protein